MAHFIPRDADWSSIGAEHDPNPCTPQIEGFGFEGILLNTPVEVRFDGEGSLRELGVAVPLCAVTQFRCGTLACETSFLESVLIVVVDARTHHVWTAQVVVVDNPAPVPPDDRAGPLDAEILIEEYFHLDLAVRLGLPARETELYVHASLGPHRSNALLTRLRRAS